MKRALLIWLALAVSLRGEDRIQLFPELAPDQYGRPAALRVSIPDAGEESYPLLVWLGGGKGATDPSAVPDLVDRSRWAVAVLPYAGNLPRPLEAMHRGQMQGHWEYHRPMFEAMPRLVPEMDPRRVVVAGFSNGGHLIASYLAQGRHEFVSLASAFAVIEGSCRESSAARRLPGRPIYLAWGAEEGGSMGLMQNIVDAARDAGMALTTRTMTVTGHGFPREEARRLKEWVASVAE